MTNATRRILLSLACAAFLVLTGCSNPGVNAGRQGGIAFIWFTIMLLATGGILWFFIGRED